MSQPAFVGRREDLDFLLAELRDPTTVVLDIFGIAGIGKSHFLREVARQLPERGISTIEYDFDSSNAGYGIDPMAFLVGLRSGLPDAAFEEYEQLVADLRERIYRLGRSLLPKDTHIAVHLDNVRFEGAVGDIAGIKIVVPASEIERIYRERQERITEAFANSLLEMARERPIVVLVDRFEVIENPARQKRLPVAEWIERDLLRRFIGRATNILFVIAMREPLPWAAADSCWRRSLRKRELLGLSSREIEIYLMSLEVPVSVALVTRLEQYTRGHPQSLALVCELLSEVGSRGIQEDAVATLASHQNLLNERLVADFLLPRILDAMPRRVSALVWAASVPHSFDASLLGAIGRLDANDRLAALQRLIRYRSFVQPKAPGWYRIHDVVRDGVLGMLRSWDDEHYRELHARAHDHYSVLVDRTTQSGLISEYADEMIYHRVPLDEVGAMRAMGERFEAYDRLYLRDRAERLVYLVNEHPMRDPTARAWHSYYLARTRERWSKWDEVKAEYSRLVGTSETDPLLRARACASLGRAHWLLDEPDAALTTYTESASLYRHLGDQSEVGWQLRNLAKIHRKHGRLDDALDLCRQCKAIFVADGDPYKLGWILKTEGEVRKQRMELGHARRALRKSLRIWDEIGFTYGTVDTLGALADVERFGGALAAAVRTYRRANALYVEHGDEHGIGWSLHGLGEIRRMQGLLRESAEFIEASLAQFTRMNYVFGVAWNLRSLGEIARMTGDQDQALECFNNAEKLFVDCGDPQGIAWTEHAIAESTWERGQDEDAEQRFKATENRLAQIGDGYMLARLHRNLAELYMVRGDDTASEHQLGMARDAFLNIDNRYQVALCDLLKARLFIMQGNVNQALSDLRRALLIVRRQGDVHHAIRALVLMTDASGDEKYLLSARRVARLRGAHWVLARVGIEAMPRVD